MTSDEAWCGYCGKDHAATGCPSHGIPPFCDCNRDLTWRDPKDRLPPHPTGVKGCVHHTDLLLKTMDRPGLPSVDGLSLDEVRSLHAGSTRGQWRHRVINTGTGDIIESEFGERVTSARDWRFICAARTHWLPTAERLAALMQQRSIERSAMIDRLVNEFLKWPLPESVCADPCATRQGSGRSGTNLLTAIEARQMFESLLTSIEEAKKVAATHWIFCSCEPGGPSHVCGGPGCIYQTSIKPLEIDSDPCGKHATRMAVEQTAGTPTTSLDYSMFKPEILDKRPVSIESLQTDNEQLRRELDVAKAQIEVDKERIHALRQEIKEACELTPGQDATLRHWRRHHKGFALVEAIDAMRHKVSQLHVPAEIGVQMISVHADGGHCHGTPLVGGVCPACGITPDAQSIQMWFKK